MRLALLSDTNSLDILKNLQELLLKNMESVEVEISYVPLLGSIPYKAKELIEFFDAIFVFVSYEQETFELPIIYQKLLEIEVKNSIKIIKAFQKLESLQDITEIEQKKLELADKWLTIILQELEEEL